MDINGMLRDLDEAESCIIAGLDDTALDLVRSVIDRLSGY
jgi:hypothetical protein